MSFRGTASYATAGDVPPMVASAVSDAVELGFELCVRPEIGRLLAVLAGGLGPDAIVGEAGTGTGAGLGWMVSAARPDVQFVSYELDADRAASAQRLFADYPNVTVVAGDAAGLFDHAPFDLLVLDGGPFGGKKPGEQPIDPVPLLKAGAAITIDDMTPTKQWPPHFEGQVDEPRVHWVEHPSLVATEIDVAPDLSVIVGRYWPSSD